MAEDLDGYGHRGTATGCLPAKYHLPGADVTSKGQPCQELRIGIVARIAANCWALENALRVRADTPGSSAKGRLAPGRQSRKGRGERGDLHHHGHHRDRDT